ncbi:putative phd-finger domain-containing protein [Golovinomyces cichoracearum]|uniref:Chromatin modification-related protein n=1 Tax=Golovinomyces cichoracearum TaxID=62708 RepID=A0A420HC59_9PEZI|nr:putative phd-finger domain-containing protein [Golovinomyces cichoracearum]
MKISKPASSEIPPVGRRSQPHRLTRNNTSRPPAVGARNCGHKTSVGTALEEATPIEIFPAITHFADAISALPKELARQFTLLKEVDAKIFIPEEELTKLVTDALNASNPSFSRPIELQDPNRLETPQTSIRNGVNGYRSAIKTQSDVDSVWDPANLNRRQLFNRCVHTMQGMLVSLDEKNHVISTAGDALAKQLARIDDCIPFIELEISEEARNGSKTHWAYPENRISKSNNCVISRKDQPVLGHSSLSAHNVTDDTTTRSDTRKQALLDKRKTRNNHTESDLAEQPDSKQKDKKPISNGKTRKVNDASGSVAVGTINNSTVNGNPSKRRKVEKGTVNGSSSEISTSSTYNNSTTPKAKPSSPKITSQPEISRKRLRAMPASSNGLTSRKRNNVATSVAFSPPSASPPTSTTIPEINRLEKMSPSPTRSIKPPAARCRQNLTQSNNERHQKSPSVNRSNSDSTLDFSINTLAKENLKINAESLIKDNRSLAESEILTESINKVEPTAKTGANFLDKRNIIARQESSEMDWEISQASQPSTITTTKSGRASKPATPAAILFPENVRSRGSRTPLEVLNSKRSHKKGAGAAKNVTSAQNTTMMEVEKEEDDEDADVDADEPRYCYCNNVSYGEMVGCDAESCKREWFHLACVGLKTAPKGNAKWYCEDCKEIIKGKRSGNSR